MATEVAQLVRDIAYFMPTLAAEVDALEMTGSVHDRMRARKAVEILEQLIGKLRMQIHTFPIRDQK